MRILFNRTRLKLFAATSLVEVRRCLGSWPTRALLKTIVALALYRQHAMLPTRRLSHLISCEKVWLHIQKPHNQPPTTQTQTIMAGQSAKKQVVANTQKLKEIHILTWGSLAVFGLFTFYFNRPASSKPFFFLSIPAFICLLIVEKTGRPQVDASGKIVRLGQDLAAPGVTEAMFDVIYVTVLLQFLAFAFGSNKVWWLYLAIPAYAGYQLWGFIKMGLGMLGYGKSKPQQPQEEEEQSQDQQKSKRQQKREARGEKPKMRYR